MKRFIEFLDNEYKDQGLVTYALHPGGVLTRMGTSQGVPAGLQTCMTSSRNGSVINMLTDVSLSTMIWVLRLSIRSS